jgi:hypothetical protein
MTDPQTPKGQDAPETVGSLCYHLRVMAGGPVDAIDADRLSRAADLLTAALARAEQAAAEVAKTDALMAAGFAEYERRLEQAKAEVRRLRAQPAQVKPMVWENTGNCWEAKTPVGTYSVGFDDGWWAELSGPVMWEWESPDDPRSYEGPHAPMLACTADYEPRIRAALREVGKDAAQKGDE